MPQDTLIRLQRTACFGPCPVYTVTIDARGRVTFDGETNVRVLGREAGRIAPSAVAKLLASAGRIGFFGMRDEYRAIENPDGTTTLVSDLPTTIVTLTGNGRTKRVEDYLGAPDLLRDFEREIDTAAGTRRWIFLDEETLHALVDSGWSAVSEEGSTLLRRAIERDDIVMAGRLIELGADVVPSQNRPSVLRLAMSGSMVDILVRAGADPNEWQEGFSHGTPLMMAAYKDAGVAEALLRAGAHPDPLDDGRSALWYAACAGNWRVVEALLRADANVRGAADRSAVECTREVRQAEASRRRTVLDRGRPTVGDYDRVIALLERAEKRRRRK